MVGTRDPGPPSVAVRTLAWVLTLAATTYVGIIVGVYLVDAFSSCEGFECYGAGIVGMVVGGPVGLVVGVVIMNRMLPRSPTRQ